MGTVAAPIPKHICIARKYFFSFPDDEEDPALEHPLFSPKYIGKMTFIIFSDFLSSVIRQNKFLSSDINLSDQNGSFDTHIAILCAIFVI